MNYSADIYPIVDELVGSVTAGHFDSVLGDRERCRGTYREFISYDVENIYPEFIIWYKRHFA